MRRPRRENQFLRERGAGCSGESGRPGWVPPSLLPSLPHSGVGRGKMAISVLPVRGVLREGDSCGRSCPHLERAVWGGCQRRVVLGVLTRTGQALQAGSPQVEEA